jgi:hypothetical protein
MHSSSSSCSRYFSIWRPFTPNEFFPTFYTTLALIARVHKCLACLKYFSRHDITSSTQSYGRALRWDQGYVDFGSNPRLKQNLVLLEQWRHIYVVIWHWCSFKDVLKAKYCAGICFGTNHTAGVWGQNSKEQNVNIVVSRFSVPRNACTLRVRKRGGRFRWQLWLW